MAEVTEHTVPVVCDACGADMTYRVTMIDETHRRSQLFCAACGESAADNEQVLEEVRARACGPGLESHTVIGKFWANVR